MQNLVLFTEKVCNTYIKPRKGESKFGEHIQLLTDNNNIYESIASLDVDYVIFGVSEDVGIYANHGKTGAYRTWETTIKSLLNVQSNTFTNAKRILVLGHLAYNKAKEIVSQESSKRSISKARAMVEIIDKDVTYIVSCILKAGKIPIIIGGGHNNAYGAIKGLALTNNTKVNAVNFDAHSDFRPEEGRHSGNGFSYAYADGFLKHYFVFGLHENYISERQFKTLNKVKFIKYNTYEAIDVRKDLDFDYELYTALKHVSKRPFGVEIDCDAIENIPSSAMSPSGFTLKQARQFVNYFGKHNNAAYLHICEAAPRKKNETQVGKLISYLITDFIRAHGH